MPHIPNSHPSKRLRLETFEIESDDIDDVEPAIKLESGGDMAPEPDVKLEPAIKLESSLENAMENNVESEPTIKWEPGLEIEIENDFVPEPTVKLEQSIGMEAEASVKVEPNVLDPPIGPRSTHGSRRHLIAIEERLLLLRPLDPTARRGKWKLASTLPIDVLPTGARIERNAANLPLPLVELLTELWSGAYKSWFVLINAVAFLWRSNMLKEPSQSVRAKDRKKIVFLLYLSSKRWTW